MRVLVFRHVPFEHLGSIADALASHGIECDDADPGRPGEALPAGEAAGLILMGGPMSANDDLPGLRQEMRLVEQAVGRGQPVLGVCLGAQLIAKALGARVYANGVKEIGWAPVSFTEAARRDALFSGMEGPETIFHWHGETFDLPSGAELLAYTEACRNQAFRVGTNVYGLQFHLEVTPEMIADWCTQDANEGDLRELREAIDPRDHAARLAELGRVVFGRWCGLVRR